MAQRRFDYAPENHNTTDVWRMAIDINGDGRTDIVDASEEDDTWVVYLNTPGGPNGITWQRRSFSVVNLRAELESRGHIINGPHVPLSRVATGTNIQIWQCWRWDGTQWNWYDDGFNNHRCQGVGNQVINRGTEHSIVEWELTDLNGDGYPDFVFDSSPVDFQLNRPSSGPPKPVTGETRDGLIWENFGPRPTNEVRAAYNVIGVRFDTGETPFALSVDLSAPSADKGVSDWECWSGGNGSCDESHQSQLVAMADVNGDGLVDRVVYKQAYLGSYDGTAQPFSSVFIDLPGAIATQINNHKEQCAPGGGEKPTSTQTQGLRDLTGDGIPDYYDNGTVWIGTGTGFRPAIPVTTAGANFSFSHETESCDGKLSHTDGGLYDLDGDGKPEVIGLGGGQLFVTQLIGGRLTGNPESGRLTGIDNGYGAKTDITYVSAKLFDINPLPFPEVVVSTVSTNGANNLGGTLAGYSYAYSQGYLVYNSFSDRFDFPGYGRKVALQLFNNTAITPAIGIKQAPAGMATITDNYPYQNFSLTMTQQQRWLRDLRVGQVEDILSLRALSTTDPWSLLGISAADANVIGVTHFDWDAKFYQTAQVPAENFIDCLEMIFPLDFRMSFADQIGGSNVDLCRAHGFPYQTVTDIWRGDVAPPSDKNVESKSETLQVDDFGRTLQTHYYNDVFRGDDDLCVDSAFAQPVAAYPHTLTAMSSRRVYGCKRGATVASESWIYDGMPAGQVSNGRLTAKDTVRYATDTGAVLGTIHAYDTTYDVNGNIKTVVTQRDVARRTTTFNYDPFGLVPVDVSIQATGVPTQDVTLDYDPLTLAATGTTDANHVRRGITYDGYERPATSTLTIGSNAAGVVSASTYFGFDGADPLGQHITVKRFDTPVAAAQVASTTGHESTAFLDELGRERRVEIALGSDYANTTLVAGARFYDLAGRLSFVTDPVEQGQDLSTAYGTSFYYNARGGIACEVRGFGRPAILVASTDGATERFPTCFSPSFANHTAIFDVLDPASLQVGAPQYGIIRRTVSTAIGRTLEHATLSNGTRLEDATYTYDELGQQASITRYLVPANDTAPVTWTTEHDSLGHILQLTAPDNGTRTFAYSTWGEPIAMNWTDGATQHSIARTYDALSRIVGSQELDNGVVDPATVNTYAYDAGVTVPHADPPAFVTGHLASATSPTSSVALSYDALGRVNTTAFKDADGDIYVHKAAFNSGGNLQSLEFDLPDNGYVPEVAKYRYDSAARLREIRFAASGSDQILYQALGIDPLGRVNNARHGAVDYHSAYAPDGRRLIQKIELKSPSGRREVTFGQPDADGRELTRTETTDAWPSGQATNIIYDALGRLATATRADGPDGPFQWRFSYDPLGNVHVLSDLLGAGDATLTYQTVDRDRLCRVAYGNPPPNGGWHFPRPPRRLCNVIHDGAGNIVSEPTANGTRQYSYFNSGRVHTIALHDAQAQLTYDPFGAVQRLDITTSGSDQRHDRHYGMLIDRRDTTSGNNVDTLLTRNIPGANGIVASRHGAHGDWTFGFGERRGTRWVADQTGAFVQDISYLPFGTPASSGPAQNTPNATYTQWNSGDALIALGVSQLGARTYDPAIGRFVGRDGLLAFRGASSSNPYAFAVNDPWNASDPSGLDCVGGIGQECDYLNSLTPWDLLAGAVSYLFSDHGNTAAKPQEPQGPKTPLGIQLMNAAQDKLGYAPKNFNFDTLMATGISLDDALDNIENTPSAERDAAIDAYNAKIDRYENYSRVVGWSLVAVGTGGTMACEAGGALLLSQGMVDAASFVGGSSVTAALGAGGGAAFAGTEVEAEIDELNTVEGAAADGAGTGPRSTDPFAGGGGAGGDGGGLGAEHNPAGFNMYTNSSGGRLFLTDTTTDASQTEDVIWWAKGDPEFDQKEINVLSGVHGNPQGNMTPEYDFYKADKYFDGFGTVRVYNIPDMTHDEITSLLNTKGTTIGAFCYSVNCLPVP